MQKSFNDIEPDYYLGRYYYETKGWQISDGKVVHPTHWSYLPTQYAEPNVDGE